MVSILVSEKIQSQRCSRIIHPDKISSRHHFSLAVDSIENFPSVLSRTLQRNCFLDSPTIITSTTYITSNTSEKNQRHWVSTHPTSSFQICEATSGYFRDVTLSGLKPLGQHHPKRPQTARSERVHSVLLTQLPTGPVPERVDAATYTH